MTEEDTFTALRGIAYGRINWKDTDVCISVECVCGEEDHLDGFFFSHYECVCGRKYKVGTVVELRQCTEEELAALPADYNWPKGENND